MADGAPPMRPIGEIAETLDALRRPVKASERLPGPYPYYGAQGIVDYVGGFLFDGEFVLVAEDGENLRSRKEKIALMARGKFWVNNHAHILRGSKEADTRYLYYAINAADISGYVTGSTIPKLSQGSLNRLFIPCPNLKDQRAIVSILAALDDKIDLNRQINETLEETARAIFKDWFVDFGPTRAKMEGRAPYLVPEIWKLFPGRLDDGGKPEGWLSESVGEHMLNFDSKRVPVSGGERAKRQGLFPYHGATGVMDHVDDYLFDGIYLLIGEDGSVVKESGLAFTQYAWGKMWVNNHAHVLQGKGSVSTEQLLMYFQHEPVLPYITGAVQLKLSQGRMNSMPFIYAGDKLCKQFSRIVESLFARLRVNTVENRTLAATRDILLPKLMSGDIRVKDAERMAETAL
jgi:type I restriction enzyme S subunit